MDKNDPVASQHEDAYNSFVPNDPVTDEVVPETDHRQAPETPQRGEETRGRERQSKLPIFYPSPNLTARQRAFSLPNKYKHYASERESESESERVRARE